MTTTTALNGLEGLDDAFLRRTIRTTLMLGLVLSAWLVQTLHMPVLGGFAAGVLIGVGGLSVTIWTVGFAQSRAPGRFRSWTPGAIGLLKVGLIFWAFRFMICEFRFSPAAIAAGTSLVILVIVLKVAGQLLMLVDRTNRK